MLMLIINIIIDSILVIVLISTLKNTSKTSNNESISREADLLHQINKEFNLYRFASIYEARKYIEMYRYMLELGEELSYLQSVGLISKKTIDFFREEVEITKAIFDDSNHFKILSISSYTFFPKLCVDFKIEKNAVKYSQLEKERKGLLSIEQKGMA